MIYTIEMIFFIFFFVKRSEVLKFILFYDYML